MKKLLIPFLFIPLTVFAHSDHDWREDFHAFLDVKESFPIFRNLKSFPRMDRIDMDSFKANLVTFSAQERGSLKGLDVARSFLKAEYEKLGFKVSLQPFATGTNFIAEKVGTLTPEKVLVLSSHIDSMNNQGANDNGTGTIGLLAVAKELVKKNYDSTIRIIGFDKEEVGLKGSDAYMPTIPSSEKIIGDINFEMMGVNNKKDGKFHVIDCNRKDSLFLSDAIKQSITELGLKLQVVNTCTSRSDHAAFWAYDIPAVVISENFFGGDSDPCYHKKCDIVDNRLNYPYMRAILEATLNAIEKVVKPIEE